VTRVLCAVRCYGGVTSLSAKHPLALIKWAGGGIRNTLSKIKQTWNTYLVQLGWMHHPSCVHLSVPCVGVHSASVGGTIITWFLLENNIIMYLKNMKDLHWTVVVSWSKKHEHECSFTVSHDRPDTRRKPTKPAAGKGCWRVQKWLPVPVPVGPLPRNPCGSENPCQSLGAVGLIGGFRD
jgi:hypothetical protein